MEGTGVEATVPFKLDTAELKALSVRSDAKGILRAGGHFAAIAIVGTALYWSLGTFWAVPLTLALGFLLAFLFNALHECAHQTAFRTRWMNQVVGHIAGLALLLPYEYYRVYHWDHHRHTQDPERDPELTSRSFPTTKLGLFFFCTGLSFWRGRLTLLLRHGVRGKVTARWVPAGKRPLIAREARAYLTVYAAVMAASIALGSSAALWLWVVPIIVGQSFSRPYLLAEHTGCAHTANMLENTRTTYTNALVRFFAWNMPFHTAHHAYPSVPFHALPALHGRIADRVTNVAQGYPRAVNRAVRHIVGLMPHRTA